MSNEKVSGILIIRTVDLTDQMVVVRLTRILFEKGRVDGQILGTSKFVGFGQTSIDRSRMPFEALINQRVICSKADGERRSNT